jgi:hypothetical protein
MNNTKTTLHGGLYDFIKDAKHGKYMSTLDSPSSTSRTHTQSTSTAGQLKSDTYQRLSPIMPKVIYTFKNSIRVTKHFFLQQFSIKIEDTTISAVRENSSNDFAAKLQQFVVKK